MPTITTFLTYDNQAEAAVKLYVSLFDGKITSSSPGPNGSVMSLSFEILGQSFIALNGGPSFKFSQGFSLFVACDSQAEIDRYWARLTDGGSEVQCGWLTDRFGVSWQIVPKNLGSLLGASDRTKANRALQAMLRMKKLDMAALQSAFDGD
ncbi:MAG: VOC family protein [Polyangiaceae bacterium]